MPPSYQRAGLTLAKGAGDAALVKDLQHDLRALGYLRAGVDGDFGGGTDSAVRALQFDLAHNDGSSSRGDGRAPVAMTSFNDDGAGGKVAAAVTGVVDEKLAACIGRLMADGRIPKLPSAADPVAANAAARAAILETPAQAAPSPFIAAIVLQESGGRHFCEPSGADSDTFVVVGLDRNQSANPEQVTSRGYGIGQYTIFHHPPRPEEVEDFIRDPLRNVQKAYRELRDKFDNFVAGKPGGSVADDRKAEVGNIPLRLCKYAPADPKYMRDCAACAKAAPKIDIQRGRPAYSGAAVSYQPTQYYKSATYLGVPDRAYMPCDWPYAARRYNGSGNNSFHYQTRVLLNLAAQPAIVWS